MTARCAISTLPNSHQPKSLRIRTRTCSSRTSTSPQTVEKLGWRTRMVGSVMLILERDRKTGGDGSYRRKAVLRSWVDLVSIVSDLYRYFVAQLHALSSSWIALMPHLLVTAGNDQHLRIWDTRHLSHLNPRSTEVLTPPPTAKTEDGKPRVDTYPTSSIGSEKVNNYMSSAKGKGLLRASYQHGKSCSAAYWDPWGRRVLTTSYDDKLRSTLPTSSGISTTEVSR